MIAYDHDALPKAAGTRVIADNCTALQTNVDAVAALRGDILLLSEVKLTKEGQVGIAGALSKLGCGPICDDPQLPMEATAGTQESIYNAERGGVAVVVRRGRKAKRLRTTGVARRFEQQGRLLHVAVSTGVKGGSCLHVVVLYGIQGAWMGGGQTTRLMRSSSALL